MNRPLSATSHWPSDTFNPMTASKVSVHMLCAFATGLLLPLGFAPFHIPGLAIASLALFFLQLTEKNFKKAFIIGFSFGLAFFGLGTSWIYHSIYTYGHLNMMLSLFITLIFVAFFSLYIGFFALLYVIINQKLPYYLSPFLFSSLWFFSEYLRSTAFTGFPWLLLGFGQMDSFLQHLLPIIGVFGVSWVTALASGFLAFAIHKNTPKKGLWLVLFISTLILPTSLKNITWTTRHHQPISVGIIQADLSMRDKWDADLYHAIESYYQQTATALMPHNSLIIMPESSIPLPSHYAHDFLNQMDQTAVANQSAVLLGIPHPNDTDMGYYHNSLMALGKAQGIYVKQHLVPFGEYTPQPFRQITEWLALPNPNIVPGTAHQPLITFDQYPIATLICYELAYPTLLRAQLPQAAFIVSISDDGWFGRSFAIYQHLQMAQALSKQTGRFQIVSNNDGLSSFINETGKIIDHLPAFSRGILQGNIYPSSGETPWVKNGETPILVVNTLLLIIMIGLRLVMVSVRHTHHH